MSSIVNTFSASEIASITSCRLPEIAVYFSYPPTPRLAHLSDFSKLTLENKETSKADEIARTYEAIVNWPLLRKLESAIFAVMFLALPFFAFKVVDNATGALAVKNSAVDLVNDLIRCKDLAQKHQVAITLSSRAATQNEPEAYLINDEQKTVEEVILPRGVNLIGSVTFLPNGKPKEPSTFIVSKGVRITKVVVDSQGMVANP